MEVQRFRDSRATELADFKKQYDFLRTEYSSALSSAIAEKDPAKQQELIQQVLSLNTRMAEELRGILGTLNKGAKGFDPKELNALTEDLIQYQKEYAKIEQAQDKVNTLKQIRETTAGKLEKATVMYHMYLILFIVLTATAVFFIFKTEWARRAVATLPTALSR